MVLIVKAESAHGALFWGDHVTEHRRFVLFLFPPLINTTGGASTRISKKGALPVSHGSFLDTPRSEGGAIKVGSIESHTMQLEVSIDG